MKGETLKGHLDMLLLAVLHRRPVHGYAIIEALAEMSGEVLELPEGTIYPALHRLERNGLISSGWTEAGGRKRRVYDLTEAGRRALREQREEWMRFSEGVNALLREAMEAREPCAIVS
jgi:PadR family transcriptional regulator, regulatory protein PadR